MSQLETQPNPETDKKPLIEKLIEATINRFQQTESIKKDSRIYAYDLEDAARDAIKESGVKLGQIFEELTEATTITPLDLDFDFAQDRFSWDEFKTDFCAILIREEIKARYAEIAEEHSRRINLFD